MCFSSLFFQDNPDSRISRLKINGLSGDPPSTRAGGKVVLLDGGGEVGVLELLRLLTTLPQFYEKDRLEPQIREVVTFRSTEVEESPNFATSQPPIPQLCLNRVSISTGLKPHL